jgi:hypothetical protein
MMNNTASRNVTIGRHYVDAALKGFEEEATNTIN